MPLSFVLVLVLVQAKQTDQSDGCVKVLFYPTDQSIRFSLTRVREITRFPLEFLADPFLVIREWNIQCENKERRDLTVDADLVECDGSPFGKKRRKPHESVRLLF